MGQEALKDHLETTWKVLDSLPDGVLLVRDDPAGTILFANSQFCQMLDYQQSEVVGQSVEMLVPDELRERHPALRESYLAAPSPRGMGLDRHLTARHKSGRPVGVTIVLSPLPEEHIVVCTVRYSTTELLAKFQQELGQLRGSP